MGTPPAFLKNQLFFDASKPLPNHDGHMMAVNNGEVVQHEVDEMIPWTVKMQVGYETSIFGSNWDFTSDWASPFVLD